MALLLSLLPAFAPSFLKAPTCRNDVPGAVNPACIPSGSVKLVNAPPGPEMLPCVSSLKFSDQVPFALPRDGRVSAILLVGLELGLFVFHSNEATTPPLVPFSTRKAPRSAAFQSQPL